MKIENHFTLAWYIENMGRLERSVAHVQSSPQILAITFILQRIESDFHLPSMIHTSSKNPNLPI